MLKNFVLVGRLAVACLIDFDGDILMRSAVLVSSTLDLDLNPQATAAGTMALMIRPQITTQPCR